MYYQEKIISFGRKSISEGAVANVARFHVEAGTIETIDIWTDFPSTGGTQRFTMRINGVDQFPAAIDQLDLAGGAHDSKTGLAIVVADGDIVSFDLTAIDAFSLVAPVYCRIGLAGGGGSIATLTDVDLTGLADGDVLIYDAGDSTWKPGTAGGGGGNGFVFFSPDLPYAVPSTEDDEFNAGSLDGKWSTQTNLPTITFTVPNLANIRSGHATQMSAITQAPTPNTDCTFRVKILPGNNAAAGHNIGLIAKEAGNNFFIGLTMKTNNGNLYQDEWFSATTINSNVSLGLNVGSVIASKPVYMEFKYTHSSKTIAASVSGDGVNWTEVFTQTFNNLGGGALEKIGIICNGGGGSDMSRVDWFRKLQGTYTGGNVTV